MSPKSPVRSVTLAALAALLALAILPAAATGTGRGAIVAGSGVTSTETRSATAFTTIALGVPARLEIRQGTSEAVSITGDDNIVPLVETVVEKGVLKIRWIDEGHFRTSYRDLAIVVDAKTVDGIIVGGSGEVRAKALKTGALNARIGGSGSIDIESLDARTANATIGGSGRFTAGGRVDSLEATIAGSGELAAGKLETRRARTTLQGNPHATVWAKDSLSATIAGSGQLDYLLRASPTRRNAAA